MEHVPTSVLPMSPIITLRYGGAPPAPHEPVTAPTPTEEYYSREQRRLEVLSAKESQRVADLEEKSKSVEDQKVGKALFTFGKIVSDVGAVVVNTASNTHAAAEAKVRAIHDNRHKERFTAQFPELVASGDTFITDYNCCVMHQGQKVAGNVQLTDRNLCFLSQAMRIREIIPLNQIVSIQKSIVLPTVEGAPPYIMNIPSPNVLPDTLQLYCVRMQLFQFLQIESPIVAVSNVVSSSGHMGRPIDRFYNFLDHAWRACVVVPCPNVEYEHVKSTYEL